MTYLSLSWSHSPEGSVSYEAAQICKNKAIREFIFSNDDNLTNMAYFNKYFGHMVRTE